MFQNDARDNKPQCSPSQQRQAVANSLARLTMDASEKTTSHVQQQLSGMAVDRNAAMLSQIQQGFSRLAVDRSSAGLSQLRYGVAQMQVDSTSTKAETAATRYGSTKMSLKRRFSDLDLSDDAAGGQKKAKVVEQ